MNRKQRRAAARKARFLTKKDAYQFGEEGRITKDACAIQIRLLRGFSLFEAILSETDTYLVPAIAQFLAASAKAKSGNGSLCLACETEFSATEIPIDFIVTTPALVDPQKILLTGICCRCAELADDRLLEIGMARMKEVWTDAVELPKSDEVH